MIIGDLSGLAITTNVPETDIDFLTLGQKVLATFSSQSEIELQGSIVSIAKQAVNAENVGYATFPILIHIPVLTPVQKKQLHIGMNAKLDIIINAKKLIKIPLKAVVQKDNKFLVKMLDPTNHHFYEREVKPGPTLLNDVIILKGLNPGEKVLIP